MRILLLLLSFLLTTPAAHAETIPATYAPYCGSGNAYQSGATNYCSLADLCSAKAQTGVWSISGSTVNCGAIGVGIVASYNFTPLQGGEYTCPSGYTLSGQNCTRPDPDPCQSRQGNTSLAWMAHNVGSASLEGQTYCDNGCTVGVNAAPSGISYTNGQKRLQRYELVQLGGSCSNGTALPTFVEPAKEPPTPPKKPVCAATEGVLTSSSGAVHCVPSATPGASVPVVTKTSQTTTNPDNTKTVTETTTTRDPLTGAEDKQTTTTTKDQNNNVIATTTTSSNTSSNNGGNPDSPNNSDLCQKNPGLQICKGGMNEEKTQIEVRDELKKLTNPGDTSYDPVKNATHSTESENALKAENDKFTDAAKGITDVTSTTRTSWQSAMDSGWFTAIPQSGCTPISGTVGGRTFTIDHCQKAAEISSIMSYGLWFSLVIGVFVMFTGGQVRSS